MKEKSVLATPSALREKIALWEGRKESSFTKSGSPGPTKLFFNAFGNVNNARGSKERSDGRPRGTVSESLSNGRGFEDNLGVTSDPASPDVKYVSADLPESPESRNGVADYPSFPGSPEIRNGYPKFSEGFISLSSDISCSPPVQDSYSLKPERDNHFLKGEDVFLTTVDLLQKKEEDLISEEEELILKEEDPVPKECDSIFEKKEDSIVEKKDSIVKKEDSIVEKEDSILKKEDSILKEEDSISKKEDLSLKSDDDPIPYRATDLRLPARNEAVCNFWKNQTLKLELDIKEEKVSALTRELSDLNFTGKAEEEVALLKKAKHDLELRVKDQEEELDDLAGQVQMLESARVRLEMSIEQMRKENRKELSQRDEELEEVRLSAQKKIKALELQLESEHEERTGLVREKHDLERRLVVAHSRSFASVDEDSFHRVKKELKKTKALLKDTQTMLEKSQSEGSNKLLMRQLKTQLEDAEFAKNAAIKARQSVETDFGEIQSQLEEGLRAKKDVEDKLARASKEKSDMQTQLEESEEEVAEVMKKYKATVSQLSVDQITISEQAQLVADLEHDKQVLQDKLTELTSKVEVLEGETANIHTQRRLQMKIKEVESKLDLELTTRQRLESQITRLKDQVERMSSECDSVRMKESQAVDHGKKLNRQLREAKEDLSNLQQKLTDASSRKQEVEKQHELAESEIITLKSDLKLAFKRIEDLQQALQGDLSDSDSEISESKHDVLGGPSLNELMAVIKEDAEEDYKESFA